MTVAELLAFVESPDLEAELALAQTPRQLDRILAAREEVGALLAAAAAPAVRRRVVERFEQHLLDPEDEDRSYDLALATLLRVLEIVDLESAQSLVPAALAQDGLWWTHILARTIDQPRRKAGASSLGLDLEPEGWRPNTEANTSVTTFQYVSEAPPAAVAVGRRSSAYLSVHADHQAVSYRSHTHG